ncbi:MAG: mechanosensitive ion channel family protein [Cellvibrionaceae bacterium]|nr:mechanosensitive ion channel family protein [Cellvibrionaceae bacterium]
MIHSAVAMPDWLSEITGRENIWIAEVFIIVVATLLVAFVARVVFNNLMKQAAKSKNLWDDALIEAAQKPVRWFVWLIGLCWALEISARQSEVNLLEAVQPIREVGVVAIIAWFLVRFISRAEKNLVDPEYAHQPMDQTTVSAMGKLLRVSVIITSVLVVLQTLGYSVSGVLAFGGIGGLAVGFAAKDLLANFFGGLMIYMDRPFKVGDWVRSPDKNIEGTVEDIGWRLTRIRTFDKRPLYVPNSTFTQISLENPSRMLNRRIYETIGIRYDDAAKVTAIVNDVKAMLEAHDEIDHDQTLMVNFNAFAPSSLDFFVYTFTKTVNWAHYHEVKQDVLLKILAIIDSHGAECAYPTSTVHLNNLNTELPRAELPAGQV